VGGDDTFRTIWKENRGLAMRLKNARFKISNASLEDLDYRDSRGLKRAQIDQLRSFPMDRASSQLHRHRAHRHRQNLPGVRPGSTRLPGRPSQTPLPRAQTHP